jgi:very-short-patch-repair endonuclease
LRGVNAFYDRSKSKTNQEEAKAVVAELFARLKDKQATKSIGVVTFSSVQATLISDLIDSQLQLEPQLENYFDVVNPEYVFVKNLENVQGDERDVILFSIGYGKDQLGKIHKNFGPLNNSGGERRLNVAVTRARNEVKIFSNFHPREFDVSGSTSQGLKLLKEYLLYAQEGSRSFLRQETVGNDDLFESPFEKQVAASLRDKGWEVRTQIGVGGYRIDLGVVHPDYPGRFLAGIECDGARYHSAKSARDRDILRQAVLEGLGWNVLRIWSTDWWYDNEKCVERIHSQLEALQSISHHAEQQINIDVVEEEAPQAEILEDSVSESDSLPIPTFGGAVYDSSVPSIKPIGEFFEQANIISEHISEVVRILSPISQEECFSLISRAWGFSKKGRRMEEFLRSCVQNVHETKSNGNNFFWNSKEEVQTIGQLRLPKPGTQRNPLFVAPEEMAIGVLSVLKSNIEVPRELLLKEAVKMLGYSRVMGDTAESVQPALELLKRQGRVKDVDGVIVYLG